MDRESIHVYEPPELTTKKELVSYPVDPDNSNWIARTCESGSSAYAHKHREFTPHGVVFKVIECIPVAEAPGPDAQRGPVTSRYRYTGDLENLPEAVRTRYIRLSQEGVQEAQEEQEGREEPR